MTQYIFSKESLDYIVRGDKEIYRTNNLSSYGAYVGRLAREKDFDFEIRVDGFSKLEVRVIESFITVYQTNNPKR